MFKLHDIFSSHMVLQRDRRILVSGTALPGRRVFVRFQSQTAEAESDGQGAWALSIGPFPVSCVPSTLTAGYASGQGEPSVELEDILVGDVWFGSGQSNMEMGLGMAKNGKHDASQADVPLFRYFLLNKTSSPVPAVHLNAQWKTCSPQEILRDGWEGFSALGYYFSRRLAGELHIPLGFIQSAYGGSKIHPWIRPDFLSNYQSLKGYHEEWNRAEEAFRANPQEGHPFADFTEWDQLKPGSLYNAMVLPFLGFPVKGVLWYQGESNVGDGPAFTQGLQAVAQTFRTLWRDRFLPFFFAQIAPYRYEDPSLLPDIWQAQYDAVDLIPNSGLVVTADCGDVDDIHPGDKRTVGERFADLALRYSYGRPGSWQAPFPVGTSLQGKEIRISFSSGVALDVCKGTPITLFELEDLSGRCVPVSVQVQGKEIVVTVPAGIQPGYVRYAWRGDIPCLELYCEDGRPVRPFRIPCEGTVPVLQ